MDNDREKLRATCAYKYESKETFHRVVRKYLKLLAKELGSYYGKHDPIRSNKGGIAVSGEITLHYEHVYIQVSQSFLGDSKAIMIRSCQGLHDYQGGPNNYESIDMLLDPQKLAASIKHKVPMR